MDGDYWAIQCKCFQENSIIDKPAVDSFLATSSREFKDENLKTVRFPHRLGFLTTNKWGSNATEAIQNQHPPVTRLNLYELQQAPLTGKNWIRGYRGPQSRERKRKNYCHIRKLLLIRHTNITRHTTEAS